MAEPGNKPQKSSLSRHGLMAEVFELLADSLGPFIDSKMAMYFADEPYWTEAAANRLGRPAEHGATDPLFQLLVLRRFWGPVFEEFFDTDMRGDVSDLIEVRNQWAHVRLPDDTNLLEQAILAAERLAGPVSPAATRDLRRLRSRIRSTPAIPDGSTKQPDSVDDEASVDSLLAQLGETESVFSELQNQYGELADELSVARKMAVQKQMRVAALEHQLTRLRLRSSEAETFLAEERDTRQRVEWLFVGLLAGLLLFAILANT